MNNIFNKQVNVVTYYPETHRTRRITMQGITKKQSNNWPISFTKMQNSCNFTSLSRLQKSQKNSVTERERLGGNYHVGGYSGEKKNNETTHL